MFAYIRSFFPSLIIRFRATEALEETMAFLALCNKDKLEKRLADKVDRIQFTIAKELLRRGVRIWEF